MLLESIFVLEFMKEQSQQKSQDIKVADFSLQMYFRLLFFFFPNNSFQITSFVHEMNLGINRAQLQSDIPTLGKHQECFPSLSSN